VVAFLPFRLERCTDQGRDRYLVTALTAGFSSPGFEPGVEITHWNGTPIARAVALNGALFAGSNDEASASRGVDSMTLRPLKIQLPPDETWVDLAFRRLDGARDELRLAWQASGVPASATDADVLSTNAAALGLDLDADEKARARKLLFRPEIVDLEGGLSSAVLDAPAAAADADVPTTMPGVFRARSVTTPSGTYGHVRIYTFNVGDGVAFRDEFVRLTGLLPQGGLILDVRGNGGGLIYAAEFTLQTMTPRTVTPEPVQFLSTPLNTRLCRRHRQNPVGIDLGPWFPSLDQASEIGAIYSAAFPITPVEGANDVGQTYQGPVVLVTDARCYSATDIFAAGFQDHGIGPVLGVDSTTGAGGANVWTQDLLAKLLQQPAPADPDSPYEPLPGGAGMRVAIRRTLRVGDRAGSPVEDLGVQSDERHELTPDDLLNDNVDLLAAAGGLLATMPQRELTFACRVRTDGSIAVDAATTGVDRLDVLVDGRPRGSVDVADGRAALTVPGGPGARTVRVEGWTDDRLVAARSTSLVGSSTHA
jgi:hypothetical protein